MRQQHFLIPTLREVPADAEIASHQFMLRAGIIHQLASGIYTFLPLGLRVLRKVQEIVRSEMNKTGAAEISMPALHPAELWQESGRCNVYGPELMRLADRHNREFALGPTHEEVVTGLLRDLIKSYKQLPINMYQIQTKFRDERRPRFGVLRSREFIMKDAYSFDTSAEGLDLSYQKMYDAYAAIFTRCGLNFRAVEADSGAIGGTGTHEFMVLSEIGEDTIAYCHSCDYAANVEKAEVVRTDYDQLGESNELRVTYTPNIRTIEQLTDFLNIDTRQIIKTVAFQVDERIVVALVRGDFAINELKLKHLLHAEIVEMLAEEHVLEDLNSVPGFLGPYHLKNAMIVADHSVKGMHSAVVGANKRDYHLMNIQPGRDFQVEGYYDLRSIVQEDVCPRCSSSIRFAKGIEVGHVFKLGTKYSQQMGAVYLDENGKQQPIIMGCYGIGISRITAAIVEQNHDRNGIIWPLSVAPFQIHLIAVNMNDELQRSLAEKLYDSLQSQEFEVLFDDRQERPGVKFKDADLIGLPVRIVVGNKAAEQIVECKIRRTGETEEITVDGIESYLLQLFTQIS